MRQSVYQADGWPGGQHEATRRSVADPDVPTAPEHLWRLHDEPLLHRRLTPPAGAQRHGDLTDVATDQDASSDPRSRVTREARLELCHRIHRPAYRSALHGDSPASHGEGEADGHGKGRPRAPV